MTITYTLTAEQYYALTDAVAALKGLSSSMRLQYPETCALADSYAAKADEVKANAKPHYTPPMLDQNDSLANHYNTLKAFGGEL